MFIGRFLEKEPLSQIDKKPLYYGTKALMDAMEDRL